MDRWALYLDIQGFSRMYRCNRPRALRPLCAVMKAIYYIGTRVCAESPNGLFAHQVGDGFIIVSEFAERSPGLPVAIGTFLLRCALLAGGIGKCGISQGEFADIQSCYPDVIRDNVDDSGMVPLGDGLMTVFPVMGTAFVESYSLTKGRPGSLLIVDSGLAVAPPAGAVVTETACGHYIVDWVHTAMPEIAELESKTGIPHGSAGYLEHLLRAYVHSHRAALPADWVDNTLRLNGLSEEVV
jgi:hypothetical protein